MITRSKARQIIIRELSDPQAYKPDPDEVFYCGGCRGGRQQRPEEGERCKICGKQTVSWHTNRESSEDAQRRWEYIHGVPSWRKR